MTTTFPIFQVDAFTDTPFSGNPAAVCLLEREQDDRWLQNVAAEMNLSETAYLLPTEDGMQLRWFTPAMEVDLCGHATLSAAHILWEEQLISPDEDIRFHTESGLLTASRKNDLIELDFPNAAPGDCPPCPELAEALGVAVQHLCRNKYDYLVEVDGANTLRTMQPDFMKLAAVDIRGVIVTCRSESPEFDFLSRYFAPHAGINEDPVTGSAHCCSGPYWQDKLGKNEMIAFQTSKRGGVVHVRVESERVYLGGKAVTTLRGGLVNVGAVN